MRQKRWEVADVLTSSRNEITVEARLVLRRAYYELMRQKRWEVADVLMESEVVFLPGTIRD